MSGATSVPHETCPRCGAHGVRPVDEKVPHGVCPSCSARVLEGPVARWFLTSVTAESWAELERRWAAAGPSEGQCPKCPAPMRRLRLGSHGAELCPSCSLLSLDAGSLAALTGGRLGQSASPPSLDPAPPRLDPALDEAIEPPGPVATSLFGALELPSPSPAASQHRLSVPPVSGAPRLTVSTAPKRGVGVEAILFGLLALVVLFIVGWLLSPRTRSAEKGGATDVVAQPKSRKPADGNALQDEAFDTALRWEDEGVASPALVDPPSPAPAETGPPPRQYYAGRSVVWWQARLRQLESEPKTHALARLTRDRAERLGLHIEGEGLTLSVSARPRGRGE